MKLIIAEKPSLARNICAGIGRGQMTILNEHIAHHQRLAKMYEKALKIYPNYPHVRDIKYPNILKKINKK